MHPYAAENRTAPASWQLSQRLRRTAVALALLGVGEGRNNNSHHFPGAERQGFRCWEIDLTYYVLRLLAGFGITWDFKRIALKLQRSGG